MRSPASLVCLCLCVALTAAPVRAAEPEATPLAIPTCGSLGPAEELTANPGDLWTYMAGGSAAHILYPYLAGCAVREWRLVPDDATRDLADIQGFFFREDGRTTGGYWQRRQKTPEGERITFNSVSFMAYDASGRIVKHSYRCDRAGTDAWEVMLHDYDAQGRQARQRLFRPAGCFAPRSYDAPMSFDWRFFYADPRFPGLPTRIERQLAEPRESVTFTDYEYVTDPGGRIIAVRKFNSDGRTDEDRYEYDTSEKIVRAEKPPVLAGRKTVWTFAYDAQGRFAKADSDEGLRFEITYLPDGRIDTLVAPTPHYNPEVDGDRRSTRYRAIYDSPLGQPALR